MEKNTHKRSAGAVIMLLFLIVSMNAVMASTKRISGIWAAGMAYRLPRRTIDLADRMMKEAVRIAFLGGRLSGAVSGTMTESADGRFTWNRTGNRDSLLVKYKDGSKMRIVYTKINGDAKQNAGAFFSHYHQLKCRVSVRGKFDLQLSSRKKRKTGDPNTRRLVFRLTTRTDRAIRGFLHDGRLVRVDINMVASGESFTRTKIQIGSTEAGERLHWTGSIRRGSIDLTVNRVTSFFTRKFGSVRVNIQNWQEEQLNDSWNAGGNRYGFRTVSLTRGYGGSNQPQFMGWKATGAVFKNGRPFARLMMAGDRKVYLVHGKAKVLLYGAQ